MNKVILMGRLTRDPEVRYSQGENPLAIARYTLAVDRRIKGSGSEQSADFIGCVAFGKSGEFAEKYFHKGTKVAISGRIQTGSYTNKDGQKVYTFYLTGGECSNFSFYPDRLMQKGYIESRGNWFSVSGPRFPYASNFHTPTPLPTQGE